MMPIEAVNAMKGKEVVVRLLSGRQIEGRLVSCDLQQNIGMMVKGELIFIQGNVTESICEK